MFWNSEIQIKKFRRYKAELENVWKYFEQLQKSEQSSTEDLFEKGLPV